MKPTREEDENGYIIRSGIHTYGETVHLFVERNNYKGVFLPGYIKWDSNHNPESIGLKYIDTMNRPRKYTPVCGIIFFRELI